MVLGLIGIFIGVVFLGFFVGICIDVLVLEIVLVIDFEEDVDCELLFIVGVIVGCVIFDVLVFFVLGFFVVIVFVLVVLVFDIVWINRN